MDSKLTNEAAASCGEQLLGALEQLQARHEWSDGDLMAVGMVAITQLVARSVGPVRAAEFFKGHGEALAAEYLRRSIS